MNSLTIIEQNNQRVLLTSQLAESYETTADIITRNFNRNIDRYQEGKHYFSLEGEEKRNFLNLGQFDLGLKNAKTLYLWTEKGALLHAKSLNTDKAWEVYDALVENYFQPKATQALSPQLQVLINLELQQKEQAKAIAETNQRIDHMQDVIRLDTTSWREDSAQLIHKIAQSFGGNEFIRDVTTEVYKLLEKRGGVSLTTRLTNKRQRMSLEGVCKSKLDKLNKVDVIGDDKKLIEIYVAIVKEMAVKYGVTLKTA